METVLITGGTGMIGTALSKSLLSKGYRVILLSRQKQPKRKDQQIEYAYWNPKEGKIDRSAIQQADHIIHLAGEGIGDKRWTANRKKEIRDSRVQGSELIVKAVSETENKIQTIISASAIGWYGEDPVVPNPHPFTEDQPAARDFLASVCREWEQSIKLARNLGKRIVHIRTGIVLNKSGGVMDRFKIPLKFGIAPILGSGSQFISWIHINDLVDIYIQAIQNKNMDGAYNAVAPNPVTNKELVLQIARKIRGKLFIPISVPSFMLKVVLGEMSTEVLKSITVSCEKIEKEGFGFQNPQITGALNTF